jgi:hypothetical protein
LPKKEPSQEALKDWVEEYGFLWDAGARTDLAKTYLTEAELVATILTAYEAILAGDAKNAVETLLKSRYDTDDEGQIIERHHGYDEKEITEEVALSLALSEVARYVNQKLKYCHPGLDWRDIDQHAKDHSNLKRCLRFDNLLGAMYLQMWWLMVSGDDLVRCQNCGQIISLASPMEGERKRRNDKNFCDDACRQKHRYYTKIRPARLEKGSRRD